MVRGLRIVESRDEQGRPVVAFDGEDGIIHGWWDRRQCRVVDVGGVPALEMSAPWAFRGKRRLWLVPAALVVGWMVPELLLQAAGVTPHRVGDVVAGAIFVLLLLSAVASGVMAGRLYYRGRFGVVDGGPLEHLQFRLSDSNTLYGDGTAKDAQRPRAHVIRADFGDAFRSFEVLSTTAQRSEVEELHRILRVAFVGRRRELLDRPAGSAAGTSAADSDRAEYFAALGRMFPEDVERRGHDGEVAPLRADADLRLGVFDVGNTRAMAEETDKAKLIDPAAWKIWFEVSVPLLGKEEGTFCRQAVRVMFETTGAPALVLASNAPAIRKAKGATDYTLHKGIPLSDLDGFEVRLASEWNDERFGDFAWCPGERVLLGKVSGGLPPQLVLRGGLSDGTDLEEFRRTLARYHLMLVRLTGEVSSAVPDNV